MKNLYILAKICKPHQVVLEALIETQKSERVYQLYDILYSGKALSNSEAMQLIYGSYKSKAFSNLKIAMFDLLMKTILTLNIKSVSGDYKKVIENARISLSARIVLSNTGDRGMAIKIKHVSVLEVDSQVFFQVEFFYWLSHGKMQKTRFH